MFLDAKVHMYFVKTLYDFDVLVEDMHQEGKR